MKKISAVIIVLFFLTLTILKPDVYRLYLLNLVGLGQTFFFPAIFPTLLFIYILLDTGILQDLAKTKPLLASFLSTFIIAFGGTPVLLCFLPIICLEEKEEMRFVLRHIAPSFSFVFFLLKGRVTPLYGYLFPALIMAIPIIMQLFFPLKVVFKKSDTTQKYSLIDSGIKSTYGAVKSLFSLILMIALVGAIKPLFVLLFDEPYIFFLQGLLEYTSGSLELVKGSGLLRGAMLIFTLMFGGISSMFVVKKSLKRLKLSRVIICKLIYATIALLPLLPLLLQGLRN